MARFLIRPLGDVASVVALLGGSVAAGWSAATGSKLGFALPALLFAALVPSTALLASAIVFGSGALQASFIGPLMLADILLLAWMARSVTQHPGLPPSPQAEDTFCPHALRRIAVWFAFFFLWALVSAAVVGGTVTPLLRLALYSAVMIQIARSGVHERLVYWVVLVWASWNVAGGVLEGQTRLVGLFIGDPAQMGALTLAALAPILTRQLVFPGRWIVGAGLLYGVWLSQTRGVWFATVIMLIMAFRPAPARKQLLVVLGLLALIGFAAVGPVTERLGLNSDSAQYRTASIVTGLHSALQNPIFGSGWAEVDLVDAAGRPIGGDSYVVPYNLFVNVFSSLGFPGVIFLAGALWVLLGVLVRAKGAPLLFVVVFLAMSLTEMTLYAGSLFTLLFFVYAGMGLQRGRSPDLRAQPDCPVETCIRSGAENVAGASPRSGMVARF